MDRTAHRGPMEHWTVPRVVEPVVASSLTYRTWPSPRSVVVRYSSGVRTRGGIPGLLPSFAGTSFVEGECSTGAHTRVDRTAVVVVVVVVLASVVATSVVGTTWVVVVSLVGTPVAMILPDNIGAHTIVCCIHIPDRRVVRSISVGTPGNTLWGIRVGTVGVLRLRKVLRVVVVGMEAPVRPGEPEEVGRRAVPEQGDRIS